jgi:hypothetical protein
MKLGLVFEVLAFVSLTGVLASASTTVKTARGDTVTCSSKPVLDPAGWLLACTLAKDADFTNLYTASPARGGDRWAWSGIRCKGGAVAAFDDTGNLGICTLAANLPVANRYESPATPHDFVCRAGAPVSIQADGQVTQCTLAADRQFPDGMNCQSGGMIRITEDGAIGCQTTGTGPSAPEASAKATPTKPADTKRASTKPVKDYLKDVDKGLNLFPASLEAALGRTSSDQMNTQLSLVTDPLILGYIESVGNRLVAASRKPDLECRYFVVNTHEVNAYALPGCFVYVDRALVDLAQSEGQLAGVMGHEIGHVIAHHGVKLMSKQILLMGLVEGVSAAVGVKSEKWGDFISAAGGLAAMFACLKYSRDDEHQADALGAETLAAAGYNPADLVEFFRLMDPKASTDASAKVSGFLSTHPLTPDRESALTGQIAGMRFDANMENAGTRNFQSAKQKLAVLNYPPQGGEVSLSNALAAVGLSGGSGNAEDYIAPIGTPADAQAVIEVPGASQWVDTGIDVEEGTAVQFWANGEIQTKKGQELSCDPSGLFGSGHGLFKPVSALNTGALIGRIVADEASAPFAIGKGRVINAAFAGRLQLGINDDNVRDNRGSFQVRILTR